MCRNAHAALLTYQPFDCFVRCKTRRLTPVVSPQVAATWFPENAAPGSFVMFPTMDADPAQLFFGHDFLHVVPPIRQLEANILKCAGVSRVCFAAWPY